MISKLSRDTTMLYSNSSSKWKRILGIDDGLPLVIYGLPPLYSSTTEFEPPPPAPAYQSRFPREIAFTRMEQHEIYLSSASPVSCDVFGSTTQPPTSKPLFFAIIKPESSSSPAAASPQPDIVLHNGTKESGTIISFANFHRDGQNTKITLCPLPLCKDSDSKNNTSSTPELHKFFLPSHQLFRTEKLVPTGGIFTTEKHGFYHTFRSTLAREKFEWRESDTCGQMIETVGLKDKENRCLVLMRVSTAESVATYAPMRQDEGGRTFMGMLKFLGGVRQGRAYHGGGLGEDFELLAIVSLLAVLERRRRAVLENRLAWGIK